MLASSTSLSELRVTPQTLTSVQLQQNLRSWLTLNLFFWLVSTLLDSFSPLSQRPSFHAMECSSELLTPSSYFYSLMRLPPLLVPYFVEGSILIPLFPFPHSFFHRPSPRLIPSDSLRLLPISPPCYHFPVRPLPFPPPLRLPS